MEQQFLSLAELIGHATNYLEKEQYYEKTQKRLGGIWRNLANYAKDRGDRRFSVELGESFIRDVYGVRLCVPWTKREGVYYRAMQVLTDFQLHGMVLQKVRRREYHFPQWFTAAATGFHLSREQIGICRRNFVISHLYLERFADFLDHRGVTKIADITIKQVLAFADALATVYQKQTINHTLRTVRNFMRFCFDEGFCDNNISGLIPTVQYNRHGRLPSAYSTADVNAILDAVDRVNPVGKRDYAVLLLATRLGIRASDIAALKFENIDWPENRIRIIQQKTGKELSLPLLDDVGVAIIDYMKFGRPDAQCRNVFLRHKPPYTEFSPSAVYSLVSKYIKRSGIEVPPGKKRGPHSLRHSLAHKLLEKHVSLPVISEILGHTDSVTTSVYLNVDVEQLRKCALEVANHVSD